MKFARRSCCLSHLFSDHSHSQHGFAEWRQPTIHSLAHWLSKPDSKINSSSHPSCSCQAQDSHTTLVSPVCHSHCVLSCRSRHPVLSYSGCTCRLPGCHGCPDTLWGVLGATCHSPRWEVKIRQQSAHAQTHLHQRKKRDFDTISRSVGGVPSLEPSGARARRASEDALPPEQQVERGQTPEPQSVSNFQASAVGRVVHCEVRVSHLDVGPWHLPFLAHMGHAWSSPVRIRASPNTPATCAIGGGLSRGVARGGASRDLNGSGCEPSEARGGRQKTTLRQHMCLLSITHGNTTLDHKL